ncbi:T9SS type A sorting domain-containing protein [bacterium]|nr:T9SS type A sorting domain-containing protein [bacterium]
MRLFHRVLTVIVLLMLVGASTSSALNITIVESQSFNPAHTMDTQWATVATAMGHTATIVPQTALDTGLFIPTTDVLIVSSASIPLTSVRMINVFDCIYEGKGVYIQSESAPTDPGNVTWQTIVNMFSTPFTWTGTMAGTLSPTVHNHIGAEYNAKPIQLTMYDGCFGTWGPGVEGNLRWQNNEVGYVFDPLNFPFAGTAMTNTDQDWVYLAPDVALMQNYIDVLIGQPPLELNLRLLPVSGPITLPSGGGTFSYNAQIIYTGFVPVTFRAWVRLILPSGAVYPPPLAGPLSFTWGAPTSTPLYSLSQSIPAFAPPGTYYVQGVLADLFTGFTTVYDSENFPFQKLVIAPDGQDQEFVTEWKSVDNFAVKEEAVVDHAVTLPEAFHVGDAYPNPFNPSTSVAVTLAEAAQLTVKVYDVQGRTVATLADGRFPAGSQQLSFDASGLASGVYFLHATVPGKLNQTRKLVLMR